MEFFKMDKGYIFTLDQHDTVIAKDKTITVLPVYEMGTILNKEV